ncbi:MAG: glycerophosphodiester phosphodiesterase, partial [Burkholderiales bacterium]|nr:glycerophosphodiester phosphodiesterase [Burkholderiales bacterium]
ALDASARLVPSTYAKDAKAAGLEIISWSLERSGPLAGTGSKGFYYQDVEAAIRREGDVMQVLDVLAREVGLLGLFSDWPATVTFYANCKGLKLR